MMEAYIIVSVMRRGRPFDCAPSHSRAGVFFVDEPPAAGPSSAEKGPVGGRRPRRTSIPGCVYARTSAPSPKYCRHPAI